MWKRPVRTVAALLMILVSLVALERLVDAPREADPQQVTLRDLASQQGLLVGTAAHALPLLTDPRYGAKLPLEFNSLTPESEMKWRRTHPERHRYDFTFADKLVSFAGRHRMQVRGHNLVWHHNNPAWLEKGRFSRQQLTKILRDHIHEVVGRYRRQVAQWDVVNEAVGDDGRLRDSVWLRTIGPEYIEMAFRWAHQADPRARLFYSDAGEAPGAKSDAVHELVSTLKQRGVPIHGVGIHMHVDLSPPDPSAVARNMARFDALGVEVGITEMDVRIRLPASRSELARQARVYRSMLRACLRARNCKTFAMWGFTDAASWVGRAFRGHGAATIFDKHYEPKPAYYEVRHALAEAARR